MHALPWRTNFPDPNSQGAITGSGSSASGINPQSPQFQAAQKSCAKLAPSGGTPAQQAQNLAQAVKYAACMRSHGVSNFPDPTSSNGGIGFESTGIDRNSPQYLAASKTCQPLLPAGQERVAGRESRTRIDDRRVTEPLAHPVRGAASTPSPVNLAGVWSSWRQLAWRLRSRTLSGAPRRRRRA